LPSVKKILGKLSSLLSAKNNTLGKQIFAECKKTLGKHLSLLSAKNICRVYLFCRVFFV